MEKAFKITGYGPTGGDCTSIYFIDVEEGATVKDVVEQILSETGEWGSISIIKGNNILNNTHGIEYKYGVLKGDDKQQEYWTKEIADRKVVSMEGCGGWSLSDYYLKIK